MQPSDSDRRCDVADSEFSCFARPADVAVLAIDHRADVFRAQVTSRSTTLRTVVITGTREPVRDEEHPTAYDELAAIANRVAEVNS